MCNTGVLSVFLFLFLNLGQLFFFNSPCIIIFYFSFFPNCRKALYCRHYRETAQCSSFVGSVTLALRLASNAPNNFWFSVTPTRCVPRTASTLRLEWPSWTRASLGCTKHRASGHSWRDCLWFFKNSTHTKRWIYHYSGVWFLLMTFMFLSKRLITVLSSCSLYGSLPT